MGEESMVHICSSILLELHTMFLYHTIQNIIINAKIIIAIVSSKWCKLKESKEDKLLKVHECNHLNKISF